MDAENTGNFAAAKSREEFNHKMAVKAFGIILDQIRERLMNYAPVENGHEANILAYTLDQVGTMEWLCDYFDIRDERRDLINEQVANIVRHASWNEDGSPRFVILPIEG